MFLDYNFYICRFTEYISMDQGMSWEGWLPNMSGKSLKGMATYPQSVARILVF